MQKIPTTTCGIIMCICQIITKINQLKEKLIHFMLPLQSFQKIIFRIILTHILTELMTLEKMIFESTYK